jgi:DNA N6-methyl adenine demethylase
MEFLRPSIAFGFCLQCKLCQVDTASLPSSINTSNETPTLSSNKHHFIEIDGKRFCTSISPAAAASANLLSCAWKTCPPSVYVKAALLASTFEGTMVVEEFVSKETAETLLDDLESREWKPSQSGRRKQDFGPGVNFKKQKLRLDKFNGLPPSTQSVVEQLYNDQRLLVEGSSNNHIQNNKSSLLSDFVPVECGVIEYNPINGASIDRHKDDTWLWGDRLIIINLLSSSCMSFALDHVDVLEGEEDRVVLLQDMNRAVNGKPEICLAAASTEVDDLQNHGNSVATRESARMLTNKNKQQQPQQPQQPQLLTYPLIEVRMPLPERSMIIIDGSARHDWTHAIHRSDITDRRISVTFRELSSEFKKGGLKEAEGNKLIDIALTFKG